MEELIERYKTASGEAALPGDGGSGHRMVSSHSQLAGIMFCFSPTFALRLEKTLASCSMLIPEFFG
jgi:delta 1-pyrroline-5-carboxylate dehydrogenase